MLTAGLVLAAVALMSIFQYSIGDAAGAGAYIFKAVAVHFQYSIGDAGGSCVWFLWVFKFLCWHVWVSAAAC